MQRDGEPIDAIDAILLESAVRLGWKNTEGAYPRRLRPFIQPAFAIQREWVAGLLVHKRMDTGDWAEMLWDTRNSTGQNIFELARLEELPESPDDIYDRLDEVGRIDELVVFEAMQDPDLVTSSVEAALYFSAHYKDDPVAAIKAWNPEGEHAKMWKKGM
jgi:uncharacterized protein with NAD-binding domain and iron-sulfur cluster